MNSFNRSIVYLFQLDYDRSPDFVWTHRCCAQRAIGHHERPQQPLPDAAGGNRNLNDQVVQFNCDSDPSRFWSFTSIGGDVVEITNLNSGLCLTVAGGNKDNNDPSVQFTCDTDASRRWHFVNIGNNEFRLRNVNSNLCLTIAGGSTDLNVVAVQFPCDEDTSRNWRLRQ